MSHLQVFWILVSLADSSNSASTTAGLFIVTGGKLSCEAGWSLIENECVAIVYTDQRTDFDHAMYTCQSVNATLPIIHSEQGWSRRVTQLKGAHLKNDAWLGLAYNPQSNKFRWMDGTDMTWSNFQVYPDTVDRMKTNCVFTNGSYKWFIQECSRQAPFICVKPGVYSSAVSLLTETTSVSTSIFASLSATGFALSTKPSIPRCSDSSQTSGVGCLLNWSQTLTWEQAAAACQRQSQSLLLPQSKEEWISFQASRIANPDMDNIWLGIWYNQKNKRIELSDGSPWSSSDWFPWSNGQRPAVHTFTDDRCVASTKRLNYVWSFEGCNQSSYKGLCSSSSLQLQTRTTGSVDTVPNSGRSIRWFLNVGPSHREMALVLAIPSRLSNICITPQGRITFISFVSRPQYSPVMGQAERISSIVIQSMGCVFIISGISLTLFLFLVFRNLSIEKIVIANQDLALLFAHCFVLTLREPALYPSMGPQLCKTVAVLLHYFFTCSYMFMLLEALQMMYIVGHMGKSGAIMPTYVFLAIGWGLPLALVAITGPIIGDEYSTSWTCWGDLERHFGWALFFPMACICSCTMIIVESAGIMSRIDPPYDADPVQLFSAKISQRGIVIVMNLTVASHILGIVAVYFQIIYLYVACFGLNVSCGTAIVFFHTAVDSKIRAFVVKMWKKAKGTIRNLANRKRDVVGVSVM